MSTFLGLALQLDASGAAMDCEAYVGRKSGKQDDKYLSMKIYHEGALIRELHADFEKGDEFESATVTQYSRSKKYGFFNMINSGCVESEDGSSFYHEVFYCGLVSTRTGCLITIRTGEFCAGSFTDDDKWDNDVVPGFDLIQRSPRAVDFVEKRLVLESSPVSTYENLLMCDPPSKENLQEYEKIKRDTIFLNSK
ncbi:hypothetical protein ACIP1T_21990 [Pseudomonas japonica]|uniref:hypothetical protein n=1 Tax=Pseudomonas japonica TaxID=256466 RepID=UPI0038097315